MFSEVFLKLSDLPKSQVSESSDSWSCICFLLENICYLIVYRDGRETWCEITSVAIKTLLSEPTKKSNFLLN